MKGRKTPSVVTKGKVAVGDMGYALELMAKSFYPTLLPAVKELVVNSVEAKAGRVWIIIYKVGENPYLMVEDDGEGMSREFLSEVAERVCDSIKREEKDLTGRHGVGMPTAARRLGAKELHVVSKPSWQEETFTLAFPLVGKELEYQVVKETRRPIRGQGTKVYLYGMYKKDLDRVFKVAGIRKKEGTSRLAEYLGQAFGRRVDRGELSICIERRGGRGGTRKEYVSSIKFLGTPIKLLPIPTRFGVIELELYCKHPKSRGTISIQHHTAPLITDITELPDFGGAPWSNFEGEITATFLERTGGGVAIAHKTYLIFRDALKREVELRLREFHRQIAAETLTADEVGKLRLAFKEVLRAQTSLLTLPKTLAASAEGRLRLAQRSSLGRQIGPIEEKGLGKVPYAVPTKTPLVQPPIPKKEQRNMGTIRVSALQWHLGPFVQDKSHLYFKVQNGVIFINTAHRDYVNFINPEPEQKPKLATRRVLKLLWMAMITCLVLMDLNMPPSEFSFGEREIQLGILLGSVSARLLA